MSTARFAQLKSIFSHALEMGEGEVAAYLDEACAGDVRLRAQLDEMLRQARDADTDLMDEPAAEQAHVLDLGTRVAGRFVLQQFLGRGGMGEVYLADDEELGGRVALKTVRGGLLDEQGALRFRREVQLSRQVTHPNICRVFDVGKEIVAGRELLFLTMEYLNGETLTLRLSRVQKLEPDEAEPLVRQMAEALDALHQKGIMHRDLKPGNVMLEPGRLCIMDFGLARAVVDDGSEQQFTQTGAILGTPGYMAPEQLMGGQATAASDIYSMGLIVFEMLTGKKASLADTLAPGKTGLPEKWERMVLQCCAKDPAMRPHSPMEAVALLDDAVAPPRVGSSKWLWFGIAAALVTIAAWVWMDRKDGGVTATANDDILQARQLLVRYYKPQNVKDALQILERVVKENPGMALGHASLCSALYKTTLERPDAAQLERARGECNRAIELDEGMAEPHVTLGSMYLDSGKRDLARSELTKALALDPKLPEVHFGLAQLYRALGRNSDKDVAIQQAIDLAPDNWAFRSWRALDYRDQGRNAEALKEIEAATALMQDNPLAYNNLGIIHMRLEQYAKAEEAFQKSIGLEKRSRTLGNLGAVYYLEAKYEDAAKALGQAVEMDPKSYLMRANLAAALDRLPGRRSEAASSYAKAIELAEPMIQATPNDQRLIANVASYHAYLGHKEPAMSMIRRAVALKPDSPDVANRAVAVHEFLKDREGALQWAARAIENGYPFETLKNDPELAGLRTDPRFNKLEGLKKENRNATR